MYLDVHKLLLYISVVLLFVLNNSTKKFFLLIQLFLYLINFKISTAWFIVTETPLGNYVESRLCIFRLFLFYLFLSFLTESVFT